jgi:hypothetical protein
VGHARVGPAPAAFLPANHASQQESSHHVGDCTTPTIGIFERVLKNRPIFLPRRQDFSKTQVIVQWIIKRDTPFIGCVDRRKQDDARQCRAGSRWLTSEPLTPWDEQTEANETPTESTFGTFPGRGSPGNGAALGLGPMTPSYARGAVERHLTSRPPEFPGNSIGRQCAHSARPFGHDAGSRRTYRATARSPSGRHLCVCRRSYDS